MCVYCVDVYICVCMYLEARCQHQVSSSVTFHCIFSDRASHETWSSLIMLGWLTSELFGYTCPWVYRLGCHTCCLHSVERSELRSSYLLDSYCILLSHLCSPGNVLFGCFVLFILCSFVFETQSHYVNSRLA